MAMSDYTHNVRYGYSEIGRDRYKWIIKDVKTKSKSTLGLVLSGGLVYVPDYLSGNIYSHDLELARVSRVYSKGKAISSINLIHFKGQDCLIFSDELKHDVTVFGLKSNTVLFVVNEVLHGSSIAVADFDQDGIEDFVVSDVMGVFNKWYKGTSNGFMEVEMEFSEIMISLVKVKDWDFDGDLDLVVASETTGKVYILFNHEGNFKRSLLLTTMPGVLDIECLDVDLNEKMDFLIASHKERYVYLYTNINESEVSYKRARVTTEINEPTSIELMDLDNDGMVDLIITAFNETDIRIVTGLQASKKEGVLKVEVVGATSIYHMPDSLFDTNRLVVSSFDKNRLYELKVSKLEY
jgi:hypothetical protein